MKINEETTISEEQVLFNKLSYEYQQFILKQMRMLQPCELSCEVEEEPRNIEVCGSLFTKSEYDKLAHSEEEKKIPEKLNIELNSGDENKVNYYRATNLACDLAFKINEIIDYLKSKGK